MSDTIEIDEDVTFVRWRATIFYRSEAGTVDVLHEIVELEELQDLVEKGPNWNTIERIEIVLADNLQPGLTIEDNPFKGVIE